MSLFNPGKRGILTLVSVLLIIGIPGAIAYADDSSDEYWSEFETTAPSLVKVNDGSTSYSFGVTNVVSDDGYTIVLDDTASDESTALSSISAVSYYQIFLTSGDYEDNRSLFYFSSDVDASDVKIGFYKGNYLHITSFTMEYNSDAGRWEYEMSATDALTISGATGVYYKVTPATSGSAVDTIEASYPMFASTSIFTDDVVELLVLVGGIALLIIGTFSLSFIDLDTPGKAANSFIRGAKSAGRKVSSYAKGRGKK